MKGMETLGRIVDAITPKIWRVHDDVTLAELKRVVAALRVQFDLSEITLPPYDDIIAEVERARRLRIGELSKANRTVIIAVWGDGSLSATQSMVKIPSTSSDQSLS